MKTELFRSMNENAFLRGTFWKRCFHVHVWTDERNFSKTLRTHYQFQSTLRNIRNLTGLPFLVFYNFCDFEERHHNINPHQRNSKMTPIYHFTGSVIANTYASSMRSRVSYRFQINSSYTDGRKRCESATSGRDMF